MGEQQSCGERRTTRDRQRKKKTGRKLMSHWGKQEKLFSKKTTFSEQWPWPNAMCELLRATCQAEARDMAATWR